MQDVAGSSCSDIAVRDNEIAMRPVRFPAQDPRIGVPDDGRGGKLAIAPAMLVRNVQPLVADGTLSWPEFWIPEGGWPPELAMGRIHDVTVEGRAWCWGFGSGGQLGTGNRLHIGTTNPVAGDVLFEQLDLLRDGTGSCELPFQQVDIGANAGCGCPTALHGAGGATGTASSGPDP